MPNSQRNIAPLIGRILMCWIFVYSAWGQIVEFHYWSGRAAQKGMPGAAAIIASITIQMVCGFAVLLGAKARVASVALVVFLVPTTLLFHNFWTLSGPQREPQLINFSRNLAIMGGLLFIATFGAGDFSVDAALAGKR